MITIKGSYVGNRRDTAEAIEFFRRGLIKAPYKTVGLSELQGVYDLMVRRLLSSFPRTLEACFRTLALLKITVLTY